MTPASGKSRGGKDLDPPPVSQPRRPPEEDVGFVATALELANLPDAQLHVRPYSRFSSRAQ